MFRNRVLTFTTAVVFGAASYAVAQPPATGSQQQPSGQQQPASQTQTQRPATGQQSAANLQSPARGTLVSVDTDERTFIITLDQAGAAGAAGAGAAQQPGAAGAGSTQQQPGAAGAGSTQQPGAAGSAQAGAARQGSQMAANQVEFNYDNDTQVTGAERGIAGLSAMKASRVTVHFVRENNEMKATRIEVMPAGSSPSSTTPGATSTPGSSTPGSTQQPRPQTNPNPDSPNPSTPPR